MIPNPMTRQSQYALLRLYMWQEYGRKFPGGDGRSLGALEKRGLVQRCESGDVGYRITQSGLQMVAQIKGLCQLDANVLAHEMAEVRRILGLDTELLEKPKEDR